MWNGKRKFLLKVCESCKNEFKVALFRPNTRFCSRKCFHKSGILSTNKERIEKIRKSMIGRVVSLEWRMRISRSRFGKKYPNLSKAKLGKKLSLEHRKKLSILRKKLYLEGKLNLSHKKGKENPNWKGGVSEENHLLRTSKRFKNWREKVFTRDNYTCQLCGDKKGGNLHAHHIKFWHSHPKLRFITKNGLTLCNKCHQEIHKGKDYGKNNRQEKGFLRGIA